MTRRRVIDRMPISATARYANARRGDPGRLHLVPGWRWWRAPLCWMSGHRWLEDGPVLLSDQLCHCRRCGEEFDARTR